MFSMVHVNLTQQAEGKNTDVIVATCNMSAKPAYE